MNKFIFSVKNLFRINWYRYFRDYLRLRNAIIMADEQHAKDGDRYYVVPTTDGTLLVVDRKNVKVLKRKHYIGKNVVMNDIIHESFYYTPFANGRDTLTPAQRQAKANAYYAWCNFQHSIKKAKKNKKRHAKS
jgi:hypothetical protein